MNAEIIAVGTELLLGQIANTNAQYLSSELAQLGINVFYHTAVGDNSSRLKDVIKGAQQRSNLIIFTGGLGPTKDDLTKETVASVLSVELEHDQKALNQIEQYFQRTNRHMTENNKKQALVLKGATVFPNDNGMAPGIAYKNKDCLYLLFPGPPSELKLMFDKYGRSFLLEQLETKQFMESRVLRFFGIGESQLETEIEDLIDSQKNPTIAPLAGEGEVTLRLTAKDNSLDRVTEMLNKVEEEIQRRVGTFFYGYGTTSLHSELFKKLQEKKLTISSAESLTGGSFANELTSFNGASLVYQGSIVCYQNEVKEKLLNVSPQVIKEHGAVSFECAKQMAEQVRQTLNSDIGVSFTGVAGPAEQEGKPVGTVFIGISIKNSKTEVYTLKLSGSRNGIRNRAVKYANFYLLKLLS
ncbi:competence/damage-inducible protein A [Bacillus sp. Marseille-P3661]|uniref:competence/damage-inducible protein A n=1 Tax=Bacillus sp. Marseille-P3661 TaxID=1936234 RepID=UPI000C857164|nr:competence/damage-inducible protein A [Bacillus sp. Marseille-P3661]